MEERAKKLGEVIALNEELRNSRATRDKLVGEIERMASEAQDNIPRYRDVSRHFSRIIKEVLHQDALFYVKQNSGGNLDFIAEFTDLDSEAATEQGRGHTYKHILCIAFDLAVLIAYSNEPFFHLVYHDGGLEQMQDKMKLALLQVIRTTCRDYNVQYLLSTLDEDLPSREDILDLCPKPEEIVLELHDGGDDGRLFKMPRF